MGDHIWEGVYSSFNEIPKAGSGFTGTAWIKNSLKKISKLRYIAQEKKSIPSMPEYHESLLPVVACMVHNDRGRVKILDFGGGIGFIYFHVFFLF